MTTAVIESRKFKSYPIDKDRCLFISDEDPFNIIFFVHNKQDEEGYGGTTFRFLTEEGLELEVKGPWATNTSRVREITSLEIEEYLDKEVTLVDGKEELLETLKDERKLGIVKFRLAGLVPCKEHTPECSIKRFPLGEFTGTGFCTKCGKAVWAVYNNEGQYVKSCGSDES